MLYITAIFSAVLALMFVKLSFRVIELREFQKEVLENGEVGALDRAIRAHANFTEYVPMGLMLMGVLELNGAPWVSVAIVGTFSVLGRYFHAQGMRDDVHDFANRIAGMKFTLVGLALSALANIVWVGYVLIASARFATSVYAN